MRSWEVHTVFVPGIYVDDQTGEIKNGYTQEAYKELMKRANEWVDKGLLDAELLTCDKKTP